MSRLKIVSELKIFINKELKSKFKDEAKNYLLDAIQSERRERLQYFTYDDLFWTHELFFLDLIQVIQKYWKKVFAPHFGNDKNRFLEHGKTINELRLDAHSNAFSEEDYEDFTNSARWIERHLKKYYLPSN